ncbi:hypothetical protein MBLNU230_g4685t1 [Neophaeotheca triangularis]
MKATTISSTLLLLSTASAQLLPFGLFGPSQTNPSKALPENRQQQQHPIMADDNKPSENAAVILSDVLGSQRAINIFASFTRDVTAINQRLETSSLNTTVLAPINGAITSLPRKPWEDAADYQAMGDDVYQGKAGEDRAQKNLRRFVEAHVVPVSPWKEGEKVEAVGGGSLWWEKKDGKAVIMPGGVEVERVVSKVKNGEVWQLKDVLNYER